MKDVPFQTRIYTVALILVTATLLAWSSAANRPGWTWHRGLVAAILVAAIVLAERVEISFPQTVVTFTVSVSSVLLLAAGVTLGPLYGALVAILSEAVSDALARRQPLKLVVNVANLGLSTFLAATIYDALARGQVLPLQDARSAIAIVLAAAAYTVVNIGVLSVIVAPVVGTTALALWRENFKGFYVELGILPTLGTVVVVIIQQNPLGLLLLAVPLAGPHVALQGLRRNQQQIRAAMERLADALERRDPYTHQHSVRVTDYVRAILDQLPHIPAETAQAILAAARIHDLGKVGTRDTALNKPGALTAAERREMQLHAEIGAEIVGELDVYRQSAAIVRHHHERWDGTGYPDGLRGEAIPLGARIIAVADSFDAMTSDRVYRHALSTSMALSELRRASGTQFDPQIVAAFERAMLGSESRAPDPQLAAVSAKST